MASRAVVASCQLRTTICANASFPASPSASPAASSSAFVCRIAATTARPPTSSSARASSAGTSPARASPVRAVRAAKDSGGGLLDKPVVAPTPGRESEFDLTKQRKKSPLYRVMLHNDNFNRREYVVQVLMKCVPGMTVDQAVNIMQEAHVNGMACVLICVQHEAEEVCLNLRSNGLVSSIEPASSPGTA
ncbi:hypothetical protein CLOM_g18146 [Closterium sp. NIES-68]|nr:hypothetical protein CLOM_g18146 [Closterium sp. NIES-68]GJP63296.1 hypothetical protein CLOP_g20369 [Closterium sp. NIES-67]